MPAPRIIRFLRHCIRGEQQKAVAVLDAATPWRGLAEVAADMVGPALVRWVCAELKDGRAELAAGLRDLADEVEAPA